jgi:putative sugar O-methyltransferase
MHRTVFYLAEQISDFLFRVRNRIRRIFFNKHFISGDPEKSDSEVSFYEDAVSDILQSDSRFKKFRRIYDYREILEHVSRGQGFKYLEKLERSSDITDSFSELVLRNDSIGKPRVYKYYEGFHASPTTLRYISVGLEIRNIFGKELAGRFAEIGAGYGGQCSVLFELFDVDEYLVYDLPIVQQLISKYLSGIECLKNVKMSQPHKISTEPIDFLVSNYAFSELPRAIQLDYLDKVISRASNGYMIMNSGVHNETGRSLGKLSYKEIQKFLPNSHLIVEEPLSSPDNYIIVWGDNLDLSEVEILQD